MTADDDQVTGNDNNDIPYIRLILSFLFWLQYSLNFVLYAASNKQYRDEWLSGTPHYESGP